MYSSNNVINNKSTFVDIIFFYIQNRREYFEFENVNKCA